MKKIFLPGFVAALGLFIACVAIGLLFQFMFPSVKAEYENIQIFRQGNDPLMYIYFLQPFLLAFALAWVWDSTKTFLTGSILKIAFYYSLVYWLVAIIPGMIMTLSSFKISVLMTITWTLSAFFQALVAMMIIIRMNK
jgi:hypothetical protein